MNYFLLEFCLALLLVKSSKSLTFTIDDVCHNSSQNRPIADYTFVTTSSLSSWKSSQYNNTDEAACYRMCCDNKLCSIAWHRDKLCVTFECDWTKTETCIPMTVSGDRSLSSKFFLLRSPDDQINSTATTTAPTSTIIPDKTTKPYSRTTVSLPTIKIIKVHISKNQTLVLPVNHVTLTATVLDDKNLSYIYRWTLLSKPSDPNSGKLDATETNELKLTDLIVGEYQFQVDVRGNNSYGKANVFVFVKPATKPNQPPIAKIEPSNQTVQLPNNVILDGSKSTDDVKIASYFWELIKGPMEAEKKIKNDESMLNLENLSAGNYTFKLTVKDETGAAASDTAYLEVLPEKDYPPVADPGNNIIVELPVLFVVLNGSNSRDDKKIVSYQWTKKSDALTADIQGVREPILNLTNLQEGTYTFNLMVTDSRGQSADKDVQVFVKPRTNSQPIAKASVTEDKSVTVRLPSTEAVLNGSLSTDDEKITKYQWKQISGKPILNIIDADKPIAYIYDLKIGVFKFNLTVYDKEQLSSSDVVTLRINESNNQKPRAIVGKIPQYYHLETNLIRIDGSASWDDVKIVVYKWTREDDSLAVGQILANSDSSPVLMLTGLLPGVYKFKFQVFDAEGLFDSVVMTLEILPSKYVMNLVELQFLCSIHQFTESRKNAFLNNIQLIVQKKLDSDTFRVNIHLMMLEKLPFEHKVTIIFLVTLNKGTETTSTLLSDTTKSINSSLSTLATEQNNSLETSASPKMADEIYIGAVTVVEALNRVRHNSVAMEYQIVRVETYVCQNNCSHHGYCNEITKLCQCERFWMSSFIRDQLGDGRPNCDWSIIYLSILIGFTTLFIILAAWFIHRFRQRRCKSKKPVPKIRKHKYVKIGDYDYENRISSNSKVPKSLTGGIKARMSMEKISDSPFNSDSSLTSDDDDDVTFVRSNGHHGDDQGRNDKSLANGNGVARKTS